MVRIISDSTCDLSKELCERYGIKLLPLHVLLGDDDYQDGVDIRPETIFEWSDRTKTTPKTAAPSLAETEDLFRTILDEGDEIVAFSISASMSSSNNVMHLAMQSLEAEDRISVIDSANLSTGIGLLVVRAAEMAQKGKERSEIVSQMERLIPLVRASFVVDTLVFLHRGGRCSGLAALAGSTLKLHPKIEVAGGAMGAGKKYRGSLDTVIMKYVREMEEQLKEAVPDHVFITHSGVDPVLVEEVRSYLVSLGRFEEIHETRAGGVISSHCGPGTLGVLFIAGA